jgi:hypothetical protein
MIDIGSDADPGSDSEPDPLPMMNSTSNSERDIAISDAAELMSAEFLVDLATSTLIAAKHVREMYSARQMQAPMPGSISDRPPTDVDIANAKQKVREAAGVMYDLALPAPAAPA